MSHRPHNSTGPLESSLNKTELDRAKILFDRKIVPPEDIGYESWPMEWKIVIEPLAGSAFIQDDRHWDNGDGEWGHHRQRYHFSLEKTLTISRSIMSRGSADLSCQAVVAREEYECNNNPTRYNIMEETVQAGTFRSVVEMRGDNLHLGHIDFFPYGRKYHWYEDRGDPDSHTDEIRQIIKESLSKPMMLEGVSLFDEFVRRLNASSSLTESDVAFIYSELQKRDPSFGRDVNHIIVSEAGYTSKSGFTFRDLFIKVDAASRLQHEYLCYMLDLGEFNSFRPDGSKIDLIVDERNMGILWIDNLAGYTPGPIKARRIYGGLLNQELDSRWSELSYNLFLMGVFHKGAKRYSGEFDDVIYQGVHGLSHLQENKEAFKSISGIGYQRFLETSIDENASAAIVLHYNERKRLYADSVIHGDWKPENMVNGHMVDYAMVGRGFEVDELAYYLSDPRFNTDLIAFHHHIGRYIRLRSTHDPEFAVRVKEGYGKQMHNLADSAYLSQLVLRHSVMNKRDMLDDNKFAQRQYYQQRIDEVLKEGRFR